MVRSIISSSSAWTSRYGALGWVYGGGGGGADGCLPEITSSYAGGAVFGGGGLAGAEDCELLELGGGGLGGGWDASDLDSSDILIST